MCGFDSSEYLREPYIAFVFSIKPGLETSSGVFPLSKQFLNTWKSATRGSGARSDGFFGAVEVVPSQRLHVRPKDEVGMAFPDFKLVLLRRAHGATYDLKNVRGCATVAVLHADGNPDYRGSAEVAGSARRDWRDQPAVRQAPRTDLDWFEQSGKSATRADGVGKIALREHNRLARAQIRGHHCKGNAEVFKVARIKNALD